MTDKPIPVDPADVRPIHDLLFTYAAANDVRDIDEIVGCFTSDGTFGLQVMGQEPVGPFGADSETTLRDFMSTTLTHQDDQRRHVITNVRIRRIDELVHEVLSYFTLVVTDGRGTRVLTTGVYHDTVAEVDGSWLIRAKWLDLDGPA
jgi:3-phenylpropionate/cinnamic acid dioxygenase small subunit